MKFNTKTDENTRVMNHKDATTNYEGGLAFYRSPLYRLYARAATTFVNEDRFYESATTSDMKLIKAIHDAVEVDPDFVLALAYYLRTELHMRSAPVVILGECANLGVGPKAKMSPRKVVAACMQRPDDMTELVAYQFARNKKAPRSKGKLPMMLKYGIARAFPKFDAYQLAKYSRDADVRLKDVMFLTHPRPRNIIQAMDWLQLANDNLPAPKTWEVMRSTGQMTWHDVINQIFYKDGVVNNYMAILRNLRNCLLSPSVTEEDIALLSKMITDEQAISRSRVLPFRYLAAYVELYSIAPVPIRLDSGESIVRSPAPLLSALETAAKISIRNLPRLPGRTCVAIDVSGSMDNRVSKRSIIKASHIANMMGLIADCISDTAYVCTFGSKLNWITPNHNALLENAMRASADGATYLYLVFEALLKKEIEVDRIMVFTDCIDYESNDFGACPKPAALWNKYVRKYSNRPHLYICDVIGYDTKSIPSDAVNAHQVSGWSESIFKVVPMIESGSSMVEQIKAYAMKGVNHVSTEN